MKIRVEMEQEPIVGNWYVEIYRDGVPAFRGYAKDRQDVLSSRWPGIVGQRDREMSDAEEIAARVLGNVGGAL